MVAEKINFLTARRRISLQMGSSPYLVGLVLKPAENLFLTCTSPLIEMTTDHGNSEPDIRIPAHHAARLGCKTRKKHASSVVRCYRYVQVSGKCLVESLIRFLSRRNVTGMDKTKNTHRERFERQREGGRERLYLARSSDK